MFARTFALLLIATALSTSASESRVPLGIQLPALLKALGYDRDLQIDGRELVVGVMFDPGDPASVETKDELLAIHKELTRLTVKGKRVAFEPLAYQRGRTPLGVDALLVAPLPPASIPELAARTAAEKIPTLATTAEEVESGLVLAMEMRDGKPRFVVNRAAAVASGVSFESGFLDLCRIVER
jgi:YfiR/HmsC-like